MASKRTRANKPEMIHCPYCGGGLLLYLAAPFVTRSSRGGRLPNRRIRRGPPLQGLASAW